MNSLSIFALSAVALMSSIESTSNVCISGGTGATTVMNGEWSLVPGKTINGEPYYTFNIGAGLDYYLYFVSARGQGRAWLVADSLINANDSNICAEDCNIFSYIAYCPQNTEDLTQCSGQMTFKAGSGEPDPQIIVGFCESTTITPSTTTTTTAAPISTTSTTTTTSTTSTAPISTITPSPTTTTTTTTSGSKHGHRHLMSSIESTSRRILTAPSSTTTTTSASYSECEDKVTFSGMTGSNTWMNGEWEQVEPDESVPSGLINDKPYYNQGIAYLFYMSGCHEWNQWIIATSLHNGFDDNICSVCTENNADCPPSYHYAQCESSVNLAECSQKWQFYNSAVSEWETDGTVKSECSALFRVL